MRKLLLTSLSAAITLSVLLAACGDDDTIQTPTTLSLQKIGGFQHSGGEAAAEITAYDASSKSLYVVNGALGTVDVLNLTDPTKPTLKFAIDAKTFWANAGAVNSVGISNGRVALAVENANKQLPGRVILISAADSSVVLGQATVGSLPDMLSFTPDGKKIVVANEGEPNSYGQPNSVDPEGSVSVLDVSNITSATRNANLAVATADFQSLNSQADALRAAGVRIFGPNATVAQDLEPEYIALNADGATAYVTLQENNAIATVDLATATVKSVKPLGLKDYSKPGNELDASNEDGGTDTNSGSAKINIVSQPVFGMYMPDAIASYSAGGKTFLITANEGDAREYTGINADGAEDARVRSFCSGGFDPAVFGAAATTIGFDSNLGRLNVTQFGSEKNAAGQCSKLLSFGARSFSIWNSDIGLVFDSGGDFEKRTAALASETNANFNASNDNNSLDSRSDDKGPEPEGVTTATFGDKTYAFIGLERFGGVMVYDVTKPEAPVYTTYFTSRAGADASGNVLGDSGPEGLAFVAAKDSPNGKPLLVVGNETTGTTAVLQVNLSF